MILVFSDLFYDPAIRPENAINHACAPLSCSQRNITIAPRHCECTALPQSDLPRVAHLCDPASPGEVVEMAAEVAVVGLEMIETRRPCFKEKIKTLFLKDARRPGL